MQITSSIRNRLKFFLLFLVVVIIMIGLSPWQARAQVYAGPQTFLLTNSTVQDQISVASAGSTNWNSQPFPMRRGRGLAYHLAMVGAQAGISNCVTTFQTATPVFQGAGSTTLVTNWSTSGTFTATVAANGTTKVFAVVLIPPTTVDNVALGRISTFSTTQTNIITIDLTNSFVAEWP